MPIPLRYSNNANVKYPLSDFHEYAVPNDILLNLSMNVPSGYVPVVSVMQVTPFTVFMAIEDSSTHALLASVLVNDPIPARVYPMTMDVVGSGYAVFGPGIRNSFNAGNVAIPLDPDTTVYSDASLAPEIQLEINGIARSVDTILRLGESTGILTFTVDGSTIYVDRNDSALTDDQIAGFASLPGASDDPEDVITTLAGVKPDSAGNIDVTFREEDLHDDCPDVYTMTPGRTLEGAGTGSDLPLDGLAPREIDPDYECGPEPPEPPPFDPTIGPQIVKTATIRDVFDGNSVGILYSTRGDGTAPGAILDGVRPGVDDIYFEFTIDGGYPGKPEIEYEFTIDGN